MKYPDADNAKRYHVVYGKGAAILMLHGGVFGYIRGFSQSQKIVLRYLDSAMAVTNFGDLFIARMALMPQPAGWNESLGKLNILHTAYTWMRNPQQDQMPVLVMAGDNDAYVPIFY